MSERKFIIGSGFYHRPQQGDWAQWLFKLWLENTRQVCPYQDIYVLASGGCLPANLAPFNFIGVNGNLGHIHNLLPGKADVQLPYSYCSWTATVLALAMIAYNDCRDLIFKEQDCLCFGPWVSALYDQLGDRAMIFGKSKHMACAQSLFLVEHSYIPHFVRHYLEFPDDRHIDWLGEAKFMHMADVNPHNVCQFDFGCDRDRPIPWDDPVFYFQKARPDELLEAQARGLLTLPPNMPQDVKVFTNDTTGL